MKVRAKCNVYHGATGELTCKEGDIFTVTNIVNNPELKDWIEVGKIPPPGHWCTFEETGGMLHYAGLFDVLDEMEKFELAIKLKRIKETTN